MNCDANRNDGLTKVFASSVLQRKLWFQIPKIPIILCGLGSYAPGDGDISTLLSLNRHRLWGPRLIFRINSPDPIQISSSAHSIRSALNFLKVRLAYILVFCYLVFYSFVSNQFDLYLSWIVFRKESSYLVVGWDRIRLVCKQS